MCGCWPWHCFISTRRSRIPTFLPRYENIVISKNDMDKPFFLKPRNSFFEWVYQSDRQSAITFCDFLYLSEAYSALQSCVWLDWPPPLYRMIQPLWMITDRLTTLRNLMMLHLRVGVTDVRRYLIIRFYIVKDALAEVRGRALTMITSSWCWTINWLWLISGKWQKFNSVSLSHDNIKMCKKICVNFVSSHWYCNKGHRTNSQK